MKVSAISSTMSMASGGGEDPSARELSGTCGLRFAVFWISSGTTGRKAPTNDSEHGDKPGGNE